MIESIFKIYCDKILILSIFWIGVSSCGLLVLFPWAPPLQIHRDHLPTTRSPSETWCPMRHLPSWHHRDLHAILLSVNCGAYGEEKNWGRKWPAVWTRDSLVVGPTQSSHPSKNVTCHSFQRVFKGTTVLLFWIRLASGQQDTGVSVRVSLGAAAIVDCPFGFPLSHEVSF